MAKEARDFINNTGEPQDVDIFVFQRDPSNTDATQRKLRKWAWSDIKSVLRSLLISDSITEGVTDSSPTQNAVFNALALKQDTILFGNIAIDSTLPLVSAGSNGAMAVYQNKTGTDRTWTLASGVTWNGLSTSFVFKKNTSYVFRIEYISPTATNYSVTGVTNAIWGAIGGNINDQVDLVAFVADPTNINQDSTHNFVTDSDIANWNSKYGQEQVEDAIGTKIMAGANITVSYNDTTGETTISSSGTGSTNLSYTASPTNGIVVSDTGTDATIPLADATNAGLLKPAKYTVLENTSGTNTGNETATSIATINHGVTAKTTPVDADEITGQDSASSFALTRFTFLNAWTNYFKSKADALYAILNGSGNVPTSNLGGRTTVGDANYTILSTDKEVVTTATLTAQRTYTLPAASSMKAGQELVIADEFGAINGTNNIVIARSGSDTINGATSETIMSAYGMRRLFTDGVSKFTFDKGVLRASNNLNELTNSNDAKANLKIIGSADISGLIYNGTSGGTYTVPANTLLISPIYTTGRKISKLIFVNIATLPTNPTKVSLAIYEHNPLTNALTPVYQIGEASITATGIYTITWTPYQLTKGREYMIGYVFDNSLSVGRFTTSVNPLVKCNYTPTGTTISPTGGCTTPLTYTTVLPSTTFTEASTNQTLLIWDQIA